MIQGSVGTSDWNVERNPFDSYQSNDNTFSVTNRLLAKREGQEVSPGRRTFAPRALRLTITGGHS